jgi:hypothetical protein
MFVAHFAEPFLEPVKGIAGQEGTGFRAVSSLSRPCNESTSEVLVAALPFASTSSKYR